jgi:hypothetical protein
MSMLRTQSELLQAFINNDTDAMQSYKELLNLEPAHYPNYFDTTYGPVVSDVTQSPTKLATHFFHSVYYSNPTHISDAMFRLIGIWDLLTSCREPHSLETLKAAKTRARSLAITVIEDSSQKPQASKLIFCATFVGRGIENFVDQSTAVDATTAANDGADTHIDIRASVTFDKQPSEEFADAVEEAIEEALDDLRTQLAGSGEEISGYRISLGYDHSQRVAA